MRQSGMTMAWINGIWAMEGNMEDLGSTSMQIICFVGLLEPLLDDWSFVPSWTWSPGALPTVRPRGRDGATFTHFLCVCKKCVVFSAINSWAAALSSRHGELQNGGVMLYRGFPIFLARASILWLCWWHGGFWNIWVVVCFRVLLLILLPSCGILEMRQCYGVRRESKGSVACGLSCFTHGRRLRLSFIGESFL